MSPNEICSIRPIPRIIQVCVLFCYLFQNGLFEADLVFSLIMVAMALAMSC